MCTEEIQNPVILNLSSSGAEQNVYLWMMGVGVGVGGTHLSWCFLQKFPNVLTNQRDLSDSLGPLMTG